MPTYKFHYFNVRGRGEISRLILHSAGVPFEDFRFEGKDWPAYKPSIDYFYQLSYRQAYSLMKSLSRYAFWSSTGARSRWK